MRFSVHVSISRAVVLAAIGCVHSAPAPAASPALTSPVVTRAADVPAPEAGTITQRDPLSAPHAVTRIMRLGARAKIPEHHHAGYDETLIVQQGDVTLMLNDRVHELRTGDVVLIPAGTVISGENGAAESVLIVAWANTGKGGPLTTAGKPAH